MRPGRAFQQWLSCTISVGGALGALFSSHACAQELSAFAGAAQVSNDRTYSWALEYQEGLGNFFAVSFMWLNEGHVPDNHRDGRTVQLWARWPLLDRKLVISAGVGPYRYFDTVTGYANGTYEDEHGWGAIYSLRAAYYASNRWIAQLQLDRIHVSNGPDSSAVLIGIGYQLDPPDQQGPRDWPIRRTSPVTDNEVTVYGGRTILNSPSSPVAFAAGIDYRHGLLSWLDVSAGYLHQGSSDDVQRDGLYAQLWATRVFFNDTVTVGVGAGPYYALNIANGPESETASRGKVSGLVSISGTYRWTDHWDTRITWNRVVTHYNADTDVIVAGIGYRW
ncbi:hypothetical protein [Pararobbsia silviterrae]|uniref:Uncharacterized protein n=1 Tax=Pararobbsia silviterrae TaxID=1792498 RepID=A0A494XNR5_9BURK|nr:hypothetical protein [Pararobbsia silviterrae]RKP49724.1 hypothetical protein D7S86_20810 [Pararobbsia silviterrae]